MNEQLPSCSQEGHYSLLDHLQHALPVKHYNPHLGNLTYELGGQKRIRQDGPGLRFLQRKHVG